MKTSACRDGTLIHLPLVLVESFKQILDWNSCRWTSWYGSFFFHNALAPTTLRSYQSAVKRYYNFCLAQNVTPFSVTEQLLCQFVASVAAQGVALKSFKVYLQPYASSKFPSLVKNPSF